MRYFYKEGTYTKQIRQKGSWQWDLNSWILTGTDIEVSEEFYNDFLIPEEERLIQKLKDLGIERDGHHYPFTRKYNMRKFRILLIIADVICWAALAFFMYKYFTSPC